MKTIISLAAAALLWSAPVFAQGEAGHLWLQDHQGEIKGAMGLLAGAELCHLHTRQWRSELTTRLGLYMGRSDCPRHLNPPIG